MTFSVSFVNKVVIVKQFLGLRESAQKVLDIHMYEYMDIYDIALMPLDALSAIAFDLPPNEFQLDPRYISLALPHLYLYRMCHSCATRALEMESPSLNAHTHACLTVYSALQKCLAWKDRQREVSTFFPVPPLLPSRFTLCNEFIIVHFVSAFFSSI